MTIRFAFHGILRGTEQSGASTDYGGDDGVAQVTKHWPSLTVCGVGDDGITGSTGGDSEGAIMLLCYC